MPFTDKPSNTVAGAGHTAAAAAAIVADAGSHDQLMHADATIKKPCPDCDALPNERCAAKRYPSGRVERFAVRFCAGRLL